MQVIEHKITQKYTDEHKYFKPLVDGLTDIELNTNLTNRTLLRVVKWIEIKSYSQMHSFILHIFVWKKAPLIPMQHNRFVLPLRNSSYLKYILLIY